MAAHELPTHVRDIVLMKGSHIGAMLAKEYPARLCDGNPCIPEEAAVIIADTLTGVVAEALQAWLNAGSERDVTFEEVGPTIEAHVKGWSD